MHTLRRGALSRVHHPALQLALLGLVFFAFGAFRAHAADTQVAIPVGQVVDFGSAVALSMVNQISAVIYSLLAVWGARLLGKPTWALISLYVTRELVKQSIVAGINSVAGAEHGVVLTIDLANQVIANSVDWLMAKIPPVFRRFVGTPQEVAQLVLAQLHIEPDHSLSTSVVKAPPVQSSVGDHIVPPAPPIVPANSAGSAVVGRAAR